MKKRFTRLLFLALLLCNVQAFAQWQVEINATPSLNKLCVSQNCYVRVYDGGTNETSVCSLYVDQVNVIGQTGTLEPQGYILVNPGSVTANNPGVVNIYAYHAGTFVCSLAVTVYPNGTVANSINGANPATDHGGYHFASGFQFEGTPTYSLGGPYAGDYSFTTSGSGSGTTCTVTAGNNAPLFAYVDVDASWIPTGSPCGLTAYGSFTPTFNKTPAISSSNALNIICSGSNTLSVTNAADISGYPSAPSPTTLPHYTYLWYNASGAISGATNSTYAATAAGSYHVVINQYNYVAGSWSASVGAATSNTIAVTTANTNPITAGFTINGSILPTSNTGSLTNYFYCDGITFANTSSAGSGAINTYEIDIINSSSTTVWSTSGNTAPPASLDLKSAFQNIGQSGTYSIKLTITNGCTTTSSVIGFLMVSGAPTASLSTTSLTTTPQTQVTYNPPSGFASFPDLVGRTSTVFSLGGNWETDAPSCSYTVSLYIPSSEFIVSPPHTVYFQVDPSTATPIWTSGSVPLSSCSTPQSIERDISNIGSSGYFSSTTSAPDSTRYYVYFTLQNDCGTSSAGEYFEIDDAGYTRMDNEGVNNVASSDNAISFYPVPFTDKVNVNINAATDANANLVIYTVDGRAISTVLQNETVAHGQTVKTINTANWAAGIYFYKLMLGDKVYSGKITK